MHHRISNVICIKYYPWTVLVSHTLVQPLYYYSEQITFKCCWRAFRLHCHMHRCTIHSRNSAHFAHHSSATLPSTSISSSWFPYEISRSAHITFCHGFMKCSLLNDCPLPHLGSELLCQTTMTFLANFDSDLNQRGCSEVSLAMQACETPKERNACILLIRRVSHLRVVLQLLIASISLAVDAMLYALSEAIHSQNLGSSPKKQRMCWKVHADHHCIGAIELSLHHVSQTCKSQVAYLR